MGWQILNEVMDVAAAVVTGNIPAETFCQRPNSAIWPAGNSINNFRLEAITMQSGVFLILLDPAKHRPANSAVESRVIQPFGVFDQPGLDRHIVISHFALSMM